MTGNRIWMMATALAIIGVIALGWFLGVAPKLAEADAAHDQRQNVEAQNSAQEAVLVNLREQFERLPELEAELEALRKELPASHEIDSFIDAVWAATESSEAVFKSVTATEAAPMGVADPSSTADAADAGVYTIEVTISVEGSFEQVVAFSRLVQEGTRTFFAPRFTSDDGGATLTGYLFVITDPRTSAPADEAEADAATEDAAP